MHRRLDTNDIGELRRAWVNEKSSPEILECAPVARRHAQPRGPPRRPAARLRPRPPVRRRCKSVLVERLLQLVDTQERALERRSAAESARLQAGEAPAQQTAGGLTWMDLNRAKFLLRAYLRTRLLKIERHVIHIIKESHIFARLSEQEKEFAKEYVGVVESHYNGSVLSDLPDGFRSMLTQHDRGEGGGDDFDMGAAPRAPPGPRAT